MTLDPFPLPYVINPNVTISLGNKTENSFKTSGQRKKTHRGGARGKKSAIKEQQKKIAENENVSNVVVKILNHTTHQPTPKIQDTRSIKIIGQTMFCKNGSAPIINSSVPHVCLLNFTVRGPVIFSNVNDVNLVALHNGSQVDDPVGTNGKIIDMSNKNNLIKVKKI